VPVAKYAQNAFGTKESASNALAKAASTTNFATSLFGNKPAP